MLNRNARAILSATCNHISTLVYGSFKGDIRFLSLYIGMFYYAAVPHHALHPVCLYVHLVSTFNWRMRSRAPQLTWNLSMSRLTRGDNNVRLTRWQYWENWLLHILFVYLNRTIPQVEVDAVSEFLFHLLTGDVDKLSTQTLVHKFWNFFGHDHKQSAKYLSCLRDWRLSSEKCYHDIGAYCGQRFGSKPLERHQQCRQLLTNETDATTAGLAPAIARIFHNYRSCFRTYRHRVDANCTNVLRKLIASRRVRAAKVVRATMDSMRPLLAVLPSRDSRHPVSTGARARVSRSHIDGQIRRPCRQPGAAFSRCLQITRRADSEGDAWWDAEEGTSWKEDAFVDKMATKRNVRRSSYNCTTVRRVISSAKHNSCSNLV